MIKRDLKDYGIDHLYGKTVAEDRSTWRASLNGGADTGAYRVNADMKRARRRADSLPATMRRETS